MSEQVFVYVIKLSQDKYYTGITNNVVKRLAQHNSGASIYTSHFAVISLVYLVLLNNRNEARKLEVKIKRFGAKRYMLKSKLSDRHYIDIKISDILLMNDNKNALNQLKMIINLRKSLIPNL